MSNPTPASPDSSVLHRPLFLWSLPFSFLYFGLPIISKEAFGASALEIGGLFSAFTVTTLLLRPLVGWSLDRAGRKPFLLAALVIYAFAMAVFAYAGSMQALYLARLLQGFGSAFLWTAANTIVADLTPPAERGAALGRISEVTSRGGLVGIFAAFFIMSAMQDPQGWRTTFLIYTAATAIGAVLAWRSVPDTRPASSPRREKMRLSRPMIALLVIVFITAVPEAMLAPIYLVFLQDKFQTDIASLAWAFFPAGLVSAFFAARLGKFSDRFGRAPMMAAGLAGTGVVSLLMPVMPSLAALAVVYTLSAVLLGLSEPAETALVGELSGQQYRGAGYGLYDFIENLGFAAGPVLGGLLYDVIGMGSPFYLNGAILLSAAGLVLLLLRRPAAIHEGAK